MCPALPPTLPRSSCSFFTRAVPSTFVFMGIADEELATTANLHSPLFRLDERVLPRGAALHAAWALRYLEQGLEGFAGSTFPPAAAHEEL